MITDDNLTNVSKLYIGFDPNRAGSGSECHCCSTEHQHGCGWCISTPALLQAAHKGHQKVLREFIRCKMASCPYNNNVIYKYIYIY